jgi:hypothetical protein
VTSPHVIRPFVDSDGDAVVAFAIEGMRPTLYPHVILSEPKVRAMVDHLARGGPRVFQAAAFDEGGHVLALVGAVVQPMLWFERDEAHVVVCRSIVPGLGAKLIGQMMAWAAAKMNVRQVSFAMEPDADGRQLAMLRRRFGFQRSQQVALWAKE